MSYKKTVRLFIALMAVLILFCVFLCIFMGYNQHVGKLDPQQEFKQKQKVEQRQADQVRKYEKTLEGFRLSANEGGSYDNNQKVQPEVTKQVTESSGYLCPYSAERIMTEDDINQLKAGVYENLPNGKGIIRMVINEMYARYGYQFTNQDIQGYFEETDWYHSVSQKETNMDIIYENMSDIEKKNIELLLTYDD